MSLPELDNLVRIGRLKREPCVRREFDKLVASGRSRLDDARNEALSLEGRFDLAYNAAHALSLAALRWHGYRSDNRYMVFQALPHTLGVEAKVCRFLDRCHHCRNLAEYSGDFEADEQTVAELLVAGESLWTAVTALPPLPDS